MVIINYLSNIVLPMTILLILFFGTKEKISMFDTFLEGAKEGIEIVVKLFPTLIGIFVAIGLLRSSGIITFFIDIIAPITNLLNFPKEIMPLVLLRPISGSASIAIGTDIMQNYGVDSKIGLIVSTIMGSTETTLYTIAVYTSVVGVKKTRFVLLAALTADFVRNVDFCHFLSIFVVKFFLTFF